MPIRLAIVDGQTLIRYGLRELVAHHSDIEIVAECQSAAETLPMLATRQPDVVTVDVALPDGDGLRLARELRDMYAGLGIVMLTSKHEDDILFRALETGVSAFVPKTAPLDEVLAAIRHAAVAAASFTASGLAMAVARRRSMQDRFALSPRESQVLNLLHEGLSIPVIAHEMYISVSTAKTYVARLYEKLGAANRAQALMTALHHGLINYRQEASPQVAMAGQGPRREAGPEGPRREAGPEGRSPVAERPASALSTMALAASRRKPAIPA